MADAAPEIAELGLRYRNLEDQQRDRDREDAVAERLDPAGAPTIAHVEAASTAQQPILPASPPAARLQRARRARKPEVVLDAGLGLDLSGARGLCERLVVAFVLVGV